MWHAVGQISTGFGLAAFLAAIGLLIYRANLRARIQTIRSLPTDKRADALRAEINAFGLSLSSLTKQQQFELAVKELEIREKRLRYTAVVVVLLALISGGVAAVAFATSSRAVAAVDPVPPHPPRHQDVATMPDFRTGLDDESPYCDGPRPAGRSRFPATTKTDLRILRCFAVRRPAPQA
jgi:hypothetical protein